MPQAAPWRVLTRRRRNAASKSSRAASRIQDWKPLLGRKVSIRYKLHDSTHPFSEAIGVVSAVADAKEDGQVVSILTRSGQTNAIAASDILAAKIFPI